MIHIADATYTNNLAWMHLTFKNPRHIKEIEAITDTLEIDGKEEKITDYQYKITRGEFNYEAVVSFMRGNG